MFANYHMHTSYSEDSCFDMEDVVKTAIKCGLDEICFTDHIDLMTGEICTFPYQSYEYDFLKCKEKYSDKITLKLGMEFGMQYTTIPAFEKIFARGNFDFILMSAHIVDNKWLYCGAYQNGKTQEEYNIGYYEEILRLVENFDNFSVLGHLDVIRRYDTQGYFPFEKIKPIVEKILKTVINKGKGIELNTSCYRYGIGDLMPSRDILRLYKSLGGKIITIGTDSHCEAHVDMDLQRGLGELLALGYTEFCTFDKMKPQFHSLEKAVDLFSKFR